MSKASKYTPTTNFNDQQASAGAVQGVSMDVEYGAIKNALNDNADKLDQIRRSDSTAGNPRLNNGVVWPETLAPATINLLTLAANTAYSIKGEWNQEAEYAVNDVVSVAYVIPGYGSLLSVTMEDELGSVIAAFQQPVDIFTGGLSAEEFEDANGKTVSYTTGSSPDGDGTAIFLCLEAHTSSTDFDTDFAAGYWFQIGGSRATSTPGAESAQAAAEAAQAAAETAQGLAEDAQVGAEAAEENAEIAQAAAEAAAASVGIPALVADRILAVEGTTPEIVLKTFAEVLALLGITLGTDPTDVPTNADLGTAAQVDTGTDPGDVPTVADLGEGAFRNGASQATAEAGTDNTDFMTALRVAQAIAALAVGGLNVSFQTQLNVAVTSATNYTYSSLGFTPKLVIAACGCSTPTATNDSWSFGVGNASSEFCARGGAGAPAGVATWLAYNWYYTTDHYGMRASIDSFGSDSVTITIEPVGNKVATDFYFCIIG